MPSFLGRYLDAIDSDLCVVPDSLDSAPEGFILLVQVESIMRQAETGLNLEGQRQLDPRDFEERFVHEVHPVVGASWSS